MPDDEPRAPVGARFHRPGPPSRDPDDETRPVGIPAPFALVRRGYDPAQVDGRLRALEEEVRALREEVRQARADAERAQAERAEAERAAAGRRTGGVDHGVEDKIARMARHEAARMRVTALADAARLLEDASTEAARAREDARRAEAQRAAADRDLARRLAQVEERERRLHDRD